MEIIDNFGIYFFTERKKESGWLENVLFVVF